MCICCAVRAKEKRTSSAAAAVHCAPRHAARARVWPPAEDWASKAGRRTHTASALQQMMAAGLCPLACERTRTCCVDPAALLFQHTRRALLRVPTLRGDLPRCCVPRRSQPHSRTVSVLLAHWDSIYVPCTGASKNGEREGNSELKNTARRVCLPGCLGFCCTAHFCSGTACAARSSFSLD